jgi:hypothetical protein
MRRIFSRTLVAVLAAAGFSGCLLVTDKHGNTHLVVFHPEPVGVVVATTDCHHGDGCGHYWYNGHWFLAGAVSVGHGHVCNHYCNHYYHDGHWYGIHKHRHGPGCGHALRGGIWVGVGI